MVINRAKFDVCTCSSFSRVKSDKYTDTHTDKIELYILYLQKKGLAPKKIHAGMVATLRDDALALSTVKKGTGEFKRRRENLEVDPRPGRPFTATTLESIVRIYQMGIDDRHLTVNDIANVMNISCERVENIFNKELSMSKVLARCVPRLSTPDQKLTILVMPEANLAMFEIDPVGFIKRFFTQDECWFHHFGPETKRQSMKWKRSTSPAPKKPKVVPSARKVLASIFWDAKGIGCIAYFQKGKLLMENTWPTC